MAVGLYRVFAPICIACVDLYSHDFVQSEFHDPAGSSHGLCGDDSQGYDGKHPGSGAGEQYSAGGFVGCGTEESRFCQCRELHSQHLPRGSF